MALSATLAFAGTSGPSPIPPTPNFQIKTADTTLCKGLTNDVPITVVNQGGYSAPNMSHVQLGLTNKSISQVYGTENALIVGNLTTNSSATVDVPVFVNTNAPPLMNAQATIIYTFDVDYQDSEARNLTFYVVSCPSRSVLSVNVTPGVLVSQQIDNLTVSLTNNGNVTLNNVSVQMGISGTQLGIQLVAYKPAVISSILPGSTVHYTQLIYENGSQIFPLNVSATFLNASGFQEVAQSFTMLSGGTIQMEPSSISVTPSTVTPGSIFSLSFIVTDVGTASVSDASATAALPKGFEPYGTSSTDFIGSIGTETPTPVSLALMANSTLRSGSYTIPVKLSYLGNFRQNDSITVNVPVTVSSSSSSGGASGSAASSESGSSGGGGALAIAVVTFIAVLLLIFVVLPRVRHAPRSEQRPR